KRRVESFRNIRRANDDDLPARDEAVHQAEQLRDDPLLDLANDLGALRRHGIDLVDEEDRWRPPGGFFENLSKFRLALAVELPHDLRAVQMNEVDPALGRDGAGEKGFARPWRPVQQDALRGEDAQLFEQTRMLEWQFDDLADPRDLALEAADVFVRDGGSRRARFITFDDADIGAFPDHDRSGGNRPHDLKIDRLGERRDPNDTAGDDRHVDQVLEHAVRGDDRRRGPYP